MTYPRAIRLLLVSAMLMLSMGARPTTKRAAAPAATAPNVAATMAAPTTVTPTAIVSIHGEIDDFSRDHLVKHFDSAKAAGAKTVILDINTYGGLVTAALDMSRYLKRQDGIHTIAFIDDKAISAGAMIAMACDEIVMVPGSVVGDCAPIAVSETSGKLEPLPAAERAKMESPILADFYDSAIRNHHDPLVAEAMVATDRSVHYVVKGIDRKFVNDVDYAKLTKEGWQAVPDVPDPLDTNSTLFTVHAELAQKIGLATIQSSIEPLASARNYNIIARYEPSPGDQIIAFLGSPIIKGLLLIIFLQSLYVSFSAPGHGLAEAIAVVSLGLFLGIPMLQGYAQWYEILLILGGLALVAFEIFVFPGHFVSAIVGLLMMLIGLVMTFVPKEPSGIPGVWPQLGTTYTALRTGLMVVTGGLAISLFLWVWLSRYLPTLPYFSRLVLTTTSPTPGPLVATTTPSAAPTWPLVGAEGIAITDLRPGGSAQFPDPATGDYRIADVVSESGYVPAKAKVTVRELRGSYAIVRTV